MRILGIVTCLAGAPVVTLAFLAAFQWADFWPSMVGIAVSLVTASAFALVWGRDLDLLTDAVRRVTSDEAGPVASAESAVLMDTLGREIERLSRRLAIRAALQEQHRRADTLILERLPDPVIVLARDRSVRRANATARSAFGDDLPAVLRNPGVRGAIDRALATNESQSAEVVLRAPVPRDLYATVVPMDPPLADGGQALVVLSDRTRERVVERMRADFVANVSHELRTPLASLIGFVETLQGPAADDPPAQRRFLGIMAEQGARMNRLIDDLLSLSRIELTEHQTPSEPLDLTGLIQRMVAGFEPRLAERNVRLALRIEEGLPIVAGDADQIAQVLQNLLDNGLKYGRDGGVLSLDVGLAEPGDRWPSRRGIVVAVADQGAGIPREHLPRLTERFYRADKGRSRAVGGTGLGLAIVKHIVNRHRGQLLIESEVGKGTTVSVWLPVTQAPRMVDIE
ncbi:MAG: two-component system, OmpR family, phosphate regulon sensor histidine kinase PhoR [Acetobacteraceae bacterium]|nr:two-component system, OmpR family, phosphate regulon sensor histidine kinase PhoR [Acetobacteraceae bacterium]